MAMTPEEYRKMKNLKKISKKNRKKSKKIINKEVK
jgi:hypothetical protein